jgi:hypothetical protein
MLALSRARAALWLLKSLEMEALCDHAGAKGEAMDWAYDMCLGALDESIEEAEEEYVKVAPQQAVA